MAFSLHVFSPAISSNPYKEHLNISTLKLCAQLKECLLRCSRDFPWLSTSCRPQPHQLSSIVVFSILVQLISQQIGSPWNAKTANFSIWQSCRPLWMSVFSDHGGRQRSSRLRNFEWNRMESIASGCVW